MVLEDLRLVPTGLRLAYHVLKNAHVVPPEVEQRREIRGLIDLLVYIEDESERRATAKQIEWKIIFLKHNADVCAQAGEACLPRRSR